MMEEVQFNLGIEKEMSDEKEGNPSLIQALDESLVSLGRKYKNLVVFHTDFSNDLGVKSFSEVYPERIFHFGLGEANMVSAALGFAVRGKLPFVLGLSIFSMGRTWEQIRNCACYPNLNIKFVGCGAGFSKGKEGASMQMFEDIALARVLPNMKVICPADYCEVSAAMSSLPLDYGPAYMRLSAEEVSSVYGEECLFQLGKANVVKNAGNCEMGDGVEHDVDFCFFAMGIMVAKCVEVARRLEQQGKKSIVVNVSSVKPLDTETVLECARKAKACVSVEEHSVMGGMGSAIAEVLAGASDCPALKMIGMEDCFGESGEPEDLLNKYGLGVDGILERVGEILRKNQ